jgi:DNA-directed RNA polymerase subunit RPC12/RpoP
MIEPYECTQCGGTDFEDKRSGRVRCAHCGSLFQVLTREPKLVIQRGAKVVFGKNADVEVRGDIQVESGAHVDVQGKVTVLRDGRKQNFRLKLIRRGSGGQEGRISP